MRPSDGPGTKPAGKPDLWLFWGKYRGPDEGRTRKFHAAIAHMCDVGAVCEALIPAWSQTFARLLGCKPELASHWVPFLIAAHDVGKLQPGFLQKIDDPELLAAIFASGLPLIPDHQRTELTGGFDHGLQSVIALTRWLPPKLEVAGRPPRGLARMLAQAVGAHHGRYHTRARMTAHAGRYDTYDRNGWSGVQDLALDWLAQVLIGDAQPLVVAPPDVSALVLTLSGLTSICDWIGSSAEDFPLSGARIGPGRYAEHARRRALRAVTRRGMLEPERLRTAVATTESGRSVVSFAALFPDKLPPRRLQEAVVALVEPRAGAPGLLVVEAPMGEGKTEAALWWAAACQSDSCRGVYLALPTQATSNAMFPRLRKTLEGVSPDGVAPGIRLIHGSSALQIGRHGGRLTPNTPDARDRRAAIDAEGWFTPRKRTLWATYAVGTVDQALMAALAVKHGFVRLAGLASKAVIIDEVHAYDVYMTSILERLLRWLAAMGTPVALLSATLPAERRARLIAAYTGRDPFDGPAAYPLVGLADTSGRVEWIEPAASGRGADVEVERWCDPGDDPLALDRLAAHLCRRIADGGCIAWIHNTVDAAQRAYEALLRLTTERPDPPIDLTLFHARFRLIDRQRLESGVVARFGPGGDRPARAILIATQVIEQSLDVDFDLMVSDIAPIDLLLQRLGRLWRHASTIRPAGISRPRLILLTPREDEVRPRFGPTERIYARFVLLKTLLALEGRTTIHLPADIRGLVEAVYDDQVPAPDEAAAAGLDSGDFKRAWATLDEERCRDQGEARTRLLPAPHPTEPFYLASDVEFEDQDEETGSDRWIVAVTRLGPPSRNVILLHRRGGDVYLDADGGVPLDLDRTPSLAIQRALMLRSVPIARREVVQALEAIDLPPGLRDCASLRHHALLVLDQGRYPVPGAGLTVRLDPSLGVVYERGNPSPADAPPAKEVRQ